MGDRRKVVAALEKKEKKLPRWGGGGHEAFVCSVVLQLRPTMHGTAMTIAMKGSGRLGRWDDAGNVTQWRHFPPSW